MFISTAWRLELDCLDGPWVRVLSEEVAIVEHSNHLLSFGNIRKYYDKLKTVAQMTGRDLKHSSLGNEDLVDAFKIR